MMNAFATKICGCATPKCAQLVYAEVMRWTKRHFADGKRQTTKQAAKTWKTATRRFFACYTRIATKAR